MSERNCSGLAELRTSQKGKQRYRPIRRFHHLIHDSSKLHELRAAQGREQCIVHLALHGSETIEQLI